MIYLVIMTTFLRFSIRNSLLIAIAGLLVYQPLIQAISLKDFSPKEIGAKIKAKMPSGKLAPGVNLGIDVLEASNFKGLRGKRVGVLTHPAGVNRYGVPTIEVLHRSPEVDVVALFAPEHGIYGHEQAEAWIYNHIDHHTGLPVYSLHGTTRKPTAEMLRGIDVLVIDLQDIGVRSYTYASCMRYAVESCFENDVEVMVLDRPNPLGGLKVDGPPIDRQWMSYVGSFSVPYIHGLTMGEMAKMAQGEMGWLKKKGKLRIVPMKGWTRDMLWADTGLKWIPTSPNIPDLSAVMGYAMTGLGAQVGEFKHGIGSEYPFRVLTHPKKSPQEIIRILQEKVIPGVKYKVTEFTNAKGRQEEGVYILVSDWEQLAPTELSFYMMQLTCQWNEKNPFGQLPENEAILYNKHVGSNAWWHAISTQGKNVDVPEFVRNWERQAFDFKRWSKRFWLYKDKS